MEHTASDYRMMSSMCLEIANAMSLESDRVRLTARAQEWLELHTKLKLSGYPKLRANIRVRYTKPWSSQSRVIRQPRKIWTSATIPLTR